MENSLCRILLAGELAVVFLDDVLDVKIVSLWRFFISPAHRYIVIIWRDKLLRFGYTPLEVDYIVFMLRVDDKPRILFINSCACRDYRFKKMIQSVLPYIGNIVFLLLSQSIYQKIYLSQIKRVVFQRQFGIFYNRVTLGFGVLILVILFLDFL